MRAVKININVGFMVYGLDFNGKSLSEAFKLHLSFAVVADPGTFGDLVNNLPRLFADQGADSDLLDVSCAETASVESVFCDSQLFCKVGLRSRILLQSVAPDLVVDSQSVCKVVLLKIKIRDLGSTEMLVDGGKIFAMVGPLVLP